MQGLLMRRMGFMSKNSSANREIRVFISSTFSDMCEERKHLNTKVFPELRSICQKRGVVFTEVDLQWGINETQSSQGGAVEVCLEEINRCHPYFIGLLGERYGWSPKDDGLKVRDDEEKYSEEDEKDLIPVRNETMRECVLTWVKDGESVTAMEIMYGVLDSEKQAEFSYFYFRDKDYTKELLAKAQADAKEFDGVKETTFIEQDGSDKQNKLTELKKRILEQKKNWNVRRKFDVEGETQYLNGYVDIEHLGNQVRKDLLKAINDKFPEDKELGPLEKERNFHAAFANSRLQSYIPNQTAFSNIFGHFESSDSPLVVTGKMGSGKSALLANFARRWLDENPQGLVIEHYAGSGGESDAVGVLRRIMNEIKHEYKREEDIPTEADDVYQNFASWLFNVTADKPLLLLLDGVNQFVGKQGELKRLVDALPEHPGQHVRVLFSTLEGEVLDAVIEREWSVEEVEPLTEGQRKELVESYLQQFTKSLPSDLIDTLINSDMADNPLFLRVVLDELRVDASHDRLKGMLDGYLEAKDLVELFEKVLGRCERTYTNSNVPHVMALIWASRYGLSEHELRSICREGTGEYVSPLYLSRLLFGLGSYLANREGLYGFMHDSLRLAVESCYLSDSGIKSDFHLKLASYFESIEVNSRVVIEYPWQLWKANAWNNLSKLLVDRYFLPHLSNPNYAIESGNLTVNYFHDDLILYWNSLRKNGFNPRELYIDSLDRFDDQEDENAEVILEGNLSLKEVILGKYSSEVNMVLSLIGEEPLPWREDFEEPTVIRDMKRVVYDFNLAEQYFLLDQWIRQQKDKHEQVPAHVLKQYSDFDKELENERSFLAEFILRLEPGAKNTDEEFACNPRFSLVNWLPIAKAYLATGSLDKAQEIYETVIYRIEDISDLQQPLAFCYLEYSTVLECTEDFENALIFRKKGLSWLDKNFPLAHENTISWIKKIFSLMLKSERVKKGDVKQLWSMQMKHDRYSENSIRFANACMNQFDYIDSEELQRISNDGVNVARCLFAYFQEKGLLSDLKEIAVLALPLYRRVFGEGHPKVKAVKIMAAIR